MAAVLLAGRSYGQIAGEAFQPPLKRKAIVSTAGRSVSVRAVSAPVERFWYVSWEDEDNGAFEVLPTPDRGEWRWVHHQVEGGWLMELVEA